MLSIHLYLALSVLMGGLLFFFLFRFVLFPLAALFSRFRISHFPAHFCRRHRIFPRFILRLDWKMGCFSRCRGWWRGRRERWKAEIATDAWLKVPNKATRRESIIYVYISIQLVIDVHTFYIYLSYICMYMINKEDKAN